MNNFLEGVLLKLSGAKKGRDFNKEYQIFLAPDGGALRPSSGLASRSALGRAGSPTATRAVSPDDKRLIATLDSEDEANSLCNALQRHDPAYAGQYWIYDPEMCKTIDAIQARGNFTVSWRYVRNK